MASGDWTGADSDGEEDMDKQDEGEQNKGGETEDEGMEIEKRKLPKHYANQVSLDVYLERSLHFTGHKTITWSLM